MKSYTNYWDSLRTENVSNWLESEMGPDSFRFEGSWPPLLFTSDTPRDWLMQCSAREETRAAESGGNWFPRNAFQNSCWDRINVKNLGGKWQTLPGWKMADLAELEF